MWRIRKELWCLIIFTGYFHGSHACQVEGHTNWLIPISTTILDTFRGEVWSLSTTNIEGINSVSYGGGLNSGPYVNVNHADSRLVISTNNVYPMYEEYETSNTMSFTVTFQCTGSSSSSLVFLISVDDTNNNPPQFQPTEDYVFTIAPPLPPGFEITGCFNDITVRDIDLTTQRIEFEIEENPYLEIEYDAAASTTAKEFKAILRTVTFIRNVPEPITLTIRATDVDLTGDPPITTSTTVTIVGDTEFEFPEEPVFAEAFYLANYIDDNQIVLPQRIYLQNGYHEQVQFSLEGEYSEYFRLLQNGNEIWIEVISPLPATVLEGTQIFLIVRADREYTSGDTATIIVQLPEDTPLEFERAFYTGTIEDNVLEMPQLILSQGYEGSIVSAIILNEYSTYFQAAVQGNTITLSMMPLAESIIEENSIINLQVSASNERSTATAVVSLEIIKDDNVTPVFNQPLYTSWYNTDTGINLEISLSQGYDETVTTSLEGEYAALFQLVQNGPILTLTATSIPPEIFSEHQILLTVIANKPRTVGGRATVIINLPAARELNFEASTYRGTLQENVLTLEPIVLTVGYDDNIQFTLTGDYAEHFTVDGSLNQVQISVTNTIPEDIISNNNIVILTLVASGLNAVTTTTSVLLDVIKADIITPVFSRNIYYGISNGVGLEIGNINLVQGFDDDVTFRIEGDHTEFFQMAINDNNIQLSLISNIPEDLIFDEKFLVFNIIAEKPLTVEGNAAILIRFPSEMTEASAILGFDGVSYIGIIQNNQITLQPITVIEGYTSDVTFELYGDLATYFSFSSQGAVVSITTQTPIPDDLLPTNRIIVLELHASSPQSIAAYATIVLQVVSDEDIPTAVQLAFDSAFYTGSYDAVGGLVMETSIRLSEGYDDSVQFALEGDHSQWFSVTPNQDFIILSVTSGIPVAVLSNNHQLVFVVAAHRSGSTSARATIVISLTEEITEDSAILGFDSVSYIGIIQNNQITLQPITVIEGYTSDVTFELYGGLASYFSFSSQGAVVSITTQTPIPDDLLPTNRIIVLELRASSPQSIAVYATIVLQVVSDEDIPAAVQLAFDSAFYTGSYDAVGGLVMETSIRLSDGYDDSVQFALEGDHSQWFSVTPNQDSIILSVTSGIPVAVLSNNHQLVFVVAAHRSGSTSARATIVISLTEEITEDSAILGFDSVSYIGIIQNNQITLQPITVIEGYTSDVTFELYGGLASYFSFSSQGAVVSITTQTPIPNDLLPTNRIIVLELRASSPQSIAAYATIVLQVVSDEDIPAAVQLAFDSAFYTGSYDAVGGLVMETSIRLSNGYDDSVQFALEGDHSQWFSVTPNQDSIILSVTSGIPVAVLSNNHQLVFVVAAHRSGSTSARATIVISLTEEITEDSAILGFDSVSYIGIIQNNQITLQPITVIEGYTSDVTFELYGGLASYFSFSSQGAVVSITTQTPIPNDLLPTNRIIVLELRASSPQSIAAYATIVLQVVSDEDIPAAVQLAFDSAFYTGSYDAVGGLVMETSIRLSDGYDDSVQFALEGDHSQWFSVTPNQDSIILSVTSGIPVAVLSNNHQLVFVVAAHRSGSTSARATIVISLTEEITEDSAILGFDSVSYIGIIQNNQITLQPITVIEGYTSDVTFELYGGLASYFSFSSQGAVVSITTQTPIPNDLLPTNRIIVLELRASSPQSIAAYATIVLQVVSDEDIPAAVQLAFDSAFYTGSYDAVGGLVMETSIRLSDGYDDSVQFALEGDHSQWFSVTPNQDSIILSVTSGIPVAVLSNNHQLVFVVAAHRSGSTSARATIVISLTEEITEDSAILGFDSVSYIGIIQNNQITLQPITVIEGYTSDVTFELYGGLASYFSFSSQGAVVSITTQTPIPDDLLPTNRIIVLELRASSPQSIAAYATIVLQVVSDEDIPAAVQLAFDSAFYTGSYDAVGGLVMETSIRLSDGYDDSVQFALEGDHSQWFSVTPNQDSIILSVTSGIPVAVLSNNHQLVFVVAAHRSGSTSARATIVISLTEEITEDSAILGFDSVSYIGIIQNNQITLQPITVIEGYTSDVTFELYGGLASYFSFSSQGAFVSITTQTPIPNDLLPTNRIIVLELRASSPQSIAAYATIVLQVVSDEDIPAAVQLAFDSAFYTGSYDAVGGLVMETSIRLSDGYDDSVQFALEGDHSQWFSVTPNQDSIILSVTSGIPVAVLSNNHQLVFVVAAHRSGSTSARATIVISLTEEITEDSAILGFDSVSYIGIIQNNQITLQPITVIEGYTSDVTFELYGGLASYFSFSSQGAVVSITTQTPIPDDLLPTNRIIVLELRASSPQSIAAYATIVLQVVSDEDIPAAVQLAFDSAFYTGSYDAVGGLVMETSIRLSDGYDDSVQFALEGDHSQWFSVTPNQDSIILSVTSGIPVAVLSNNHQLVFVVAAHRSGSTSARATIVISLTEEITEDSAILGFDSVSYIGIIQNNQITLQPITVIEGYTSDVTFELYGGLASYFSFSSQGAVVSITTQTPIPNDLLPTNRIIVLELRASSPQSIAAYATIVLQVISDEDIPAAVQLAFDSAFYTGSYDAVGGLVMETSIRLSNGYDDSVQFALEGDHSQWFSVTPNQDSIILSVTSGIPVAVLSNNHQLVFVVAAHRSGSTSARATIVISLTEEITEDSAILGFDSVSYIGIIQNNQITLQPITVIEGYTSDVTFELYGGLASYFSFSSQGAVVSITTQTPIPDDLLPTNRIIVLELRASSPQSIAAYATIVLQVVSDEDIPAAVQLAFDSAFYTGSYDAVGGLVMETSIRLSDGYDDSVQFALEGDHSQWFSVTHSQDSIILSVTSGIPVAVLSNNHQLVFVVAAHRSGSTSARATVVISLTEDSQTGNDVSFEKVLYEGIIQLGNVVHESIIIPGYSETTVEVLGVYGSLFVAQAEDGTVTVRSSGSVTLPADVTSVVLELHAGTASAVLILNVVEGDAPIIPSVSFNSESYVLRVDMYQTGLVGRVQATADNGEAVTYSTALNSAHLETRLSINNGGELYLSAPADSGVYTFRVIATTVITQVSDTATVYLTVEAVTVCGETDIVVPPLIIIDRDEEENHNNLVVLDGAQYQGCQFTLTNRWPLDQTWLYVDEYGLHTTAIDREHESIAFMALSQVQVELILNCENDAARTKRSRRTDWLGPYDYGTNKWILTDTIPFNPRRSLVNLIVNDINDNAPIFVGKEFEPVAVGYPESDIEDRILPRSLVELKATDADVGENAELIYTSSEPQLAVASKSGFVHVRNGAQLENNQVLTVNAIDRNGQGLIGTLQIQVKLLDLGKIAVVTVRDAFLDDEEAILVQLSDAVGYEVRTLRSIVISDDIDDTDVSRKKRDTNVSGVALQLYVYGLVDREPVPVSQLAIDLTNTNLENVSIVSTVSLEDHLEGSVISIFERDTGLLAATIVLSILLFLLMVAVIVWFFLNWRANTKYEQFSDANSLASRNESLSEPPKSTEIPKPRLNLQELKKSERRLQEMLNSPIEEVTVEPPVSKKDAPFESVVEMPSTPYNMPIVIQSIDKLKDAEDTDDDEFGEAKQARRKSVVTFNENVEKIIHVEDVPDDNSSSSEDFEIYRL